MIFKVKMKINSRNHYTFTATKLPPQRVDNILLRGSSITNPLSMYRLKKIGVKQVIDLRTHLISRIPEILMCKIFGIKYNNFEYSHKKAIFPNSDFFQKINDTILQNQGKTYIHCRHGKRRTGVCVAVYEKFHTNKTPQDIIKELYDTGFNEICKNYDKIPREKYNKFIKIYNSFIEKFYPQEEKLRYKK